MQNQTTIIPLLPQMETAIGELKDIGKVFAYNHVDTISKYFNKHTSEIDLNVRFHDLRHTSATLMLSKGIPLEVVQKILGHGSITTTQIYAKVLDRVLEKEMQKMKDIF